MIYPFDEKRCCFCSVLLPHLKITCPDCECVYNDCEDWSGPAHSKDECIFNLKEKLKSLNYKNNIINLERINKTNGI